MPIDTSIITGTQEHKHTADSSDGGFLDVNAITGATSLTQGGLIVGNNANQMTNLPIGAGLQYVRANAAATGLEYATLAAGGASCSDSLTISGQTNTLCKWLELSA
tara:strand:- start:534 stop:851 length:318 start_codon:yes stop_codon:yes gene_type:complete